MTLDYDKAGEKLKILKSIIKTNKGDYVMLCYTMKTVFNCRQCESLSVELSVVKCLYMMNFCGNFQNVHCMK